MPPATGGDPDFPDEPIRSRSLASPLLPPPAVHSFRPEESARPMNSVQTAPLAPYAAALNDFAAGNRSASILMRTSLGERESGPERLEQAVVAIQVALEVFQEAQAEHYISIAEENLAKAERLLAERRRGGPDAG